MFNDLKNEAKIGLKISDKSFFFEVKFFSKCSKKFSIGYMMMFKVCKSCLQPCSLRQKKKWSYDKYFKIYSKKLTPPLTPLREGGSTASTQL